MAKTIQSTGNYTVKATGQEVAYEFEYQAFDNLADAVASLGEDKALQTIQRMVKVDANNLARESAKVNNGHSERKPMSEEEKALKKVERQANSEILKLIKAKGLNLDELKGLL
jgi:hypothetical protein